ALQRDRLPEAEQQFKKVMALAPKDPFGYANLKLTFMRAGRYKEAEDQLRRAAKLDPTNVDIGLMTARLYSLTNRRDDARATLETIKQREPRNPRVLYALAELQAQDSSAAETRAYEDRLRDVLAVAPANLAVRLKLTSLLARRGETDSVVRHLEEVRQI